MSNAIEAAQGNKVASTTPAKATPPVLEPKAKLTITMEIDYSKLDKACAQLARAGGVDGNLFVKFGREVVALCKLGVPLNEIYNRTLLTGLHDFEEVKSLREAMNASTFFDFAEKTLLHSANGVKRSFYKILYTLQRRKGEKALTPDALCVAIDDARSMGFVAMRQKYFPKAEKSSTEGESEETDAEEKSEGTPSTLADYVSEVRKLTMAAMNLASTSEGQVANFNAILEACMAVHDETLSSVSSTPSTTASEANELENAELVA